MSSFPLPEGLPVPVDDGACDHLAGQKLPAVALPVASDPSKQVVLAQLAGLSVLFFYPRTASPGENVPDEWNAIPGARGCTPQMCSFRDSLKDLRSAGVDHVFGVSTQAIEEQQEAKGRLELPYDLLNDSQRGLVEGLKLPTFEWEGKQVVKRLSLIVEDGRILKCHYPVFPSDKNVQMVLEWLRNR